MHMLKALTVTVVNSLSLFDVNMHRAHNCSGVASSRIIHLCRSSCCDASTTSCALKAWWPMKYWLITSSPTSCHILEEPICLKMWQDVGEDVIG